MAENRQAYLNRIENAGSTKAPRLEAAGAAAADQAAKYKIVMERQQSPARAGDDELRGVRLAVERAQHEVGKRAV